ncbi:hypothetical protein KHA80_23045 [Anaerobacillus sp. HL2]|nr:hypothetical protein KHA80_23045 [Anaerobacillus sp. HL2]
MIISTIKKHFFNQKRPCCYQSQAVDHCDVLEQLIKKFIPNLQVSLLTGKVSKSERELVIEKARNGEIQIIIIATISCR